MRADRTSLSGALVGAACALLLAGCTAVVDRSSLLPDLPAPTTQGCTAALPTGYQREESMLELPALGAVHAVRLQHPANARTIVYAGGNGSFAQTSDRFLVQLATLTSSNVVTFDYPGRGGTTVPKTVDALIQFGPAFRQALARAGWLRGELYAYGFSFGGAPAANLAATGGFAGLILEGSASDIPSVARNMVPGVLRPFIRLRVDPDLQRYDYFGYVVAAKAPVLLLAGKDDRTVDARTVTRFAADLERAGVSLRLVTTPGGHGDSLSSAEGADAVKLFVKSRD